MTLALTHTLSLTLTQRTTDSTRPRSEMARAMLAVVKMNTVVMSTCDMPASIVEPHAWRVRVRVRMRG